MKRPGRNLSTEKKKRVTYYLPERVINLLNGIHNKSQLIEKLIVEWSKKSTKQSQ